MQNKLELANKYYAVAADVREQAEFLAAMADTLDSYADRLCEQNMREASKGSTSRPLQETP